MALIDYISPKVLSDEGYIHNSDKAAMFDNIGAAYLNSRGWVDMTAVRAVPISINKAAQIAGIAASTLAGYVSLGYMQADDDGHVSLLDALTFDAKAAKRRLLDSRPRFVNRRVHRKGKSRRKEGGGA